MKEPLPNPVLEQTQQPVSPRSFPSGNTGSPMLYSPRPRPVRSPRRPLNPSSILLVLLGLAVAIVLYISNIIAVNQLLHDINALEAEHRHILMEQERLKAQINRMASLERIQERAEQELGLISLREPPVWIEVDQDLIRELEQRAQR